MSSVCKTMDYVCGQYVKPSTWGVCVTVCSLLYRRCVVDSVWCQYVKPSTCVLCVTVGSLLYRTCVVDSVCCQYVKPWIMCVVSM